MATRQPSAVVAFCVVALLLLAASPATTAQSEDGLPRPDGYPAAPTVAYGALPTTDPPANCEWYGFSHIEYPSMSSTCEARTRTVLANSTSQFSPFAYYYIQSMVFDSITNDSYCIQGCFNLEGTSPAPPPGFQLAPPPGAAVDAPPPATETTPPPALLSPPPPALVDSPPPLVDSPPPVVDSPPPLADSLPPPPAPVSLFDPPPPPTTETPVATPPPGTRVINLSGAAMGFQPTGFLFIFLSAMALILGAL